MSDRHDPALVERVAQALRDADDAALVRTNFGQLTAGYDESARAVLDAIAADLAETDAALDQAVGMANDLASEIAAAQPAPAPGHGVEHAVTRRLRAAALAATQRTAWVAAAVHNAARTAAAALADGTDPARVAEWLFVASVRIARVAGPVDGDVAARAYNACLQRMVRR